MTTYSAITNGEIDPASPGTEPLFAKLRDNPIAIAEGASGAPAIQIDAALKGTVAAGATRRLGDFALTLTTATTLPAVIVQIIQTGTVRVSFNHFNGPASGTVTATVAKDTKGDGSFSTVQSWALGSGSAVRSVDVTVAAGDVIKVSGTSTVSGSGAVINGGEFLTDGGFLWPAALYSADGATTYDFN